jgi:hypothetical protein
MSTTTGPVHVEGRLEQEPSRWLWLVKWLLVIPHYVVLFFLWIAFAVSTVVTFFAILFTGRYPRAIFDFNVGVLRWSWRVAFYAYSALGTDRYPPFTLADVPDYPARLGIDYPDHLSRGLVLVKWWLLAIPHYLVLAIFLGGGWFAVRGADEDVTTGPGLIGLLVLIAGVVLLFTGRYPKPIFDFVLGLNRWVLRVAAYVALMTDAYPPFRLDLGGQEPGDASFVAPPPTSPPPATPQPPVTWTAGRIVAIVAGSVLIVSGAGLGLGGLAVGAANVGLRDSGDFLVSGDEHLSSSSHALVSDSLEMEYDGPTDLLENVIGDVRVTAKADDPDVRMFLGVARTEDVSDYLAGVDHDMLTDFVGEDGDPSYQHTTGSAPSEPPGSLDIWVASSSGTGERELTWTPESGDWTIVLMRADAEAGVAADVEVGAEFPSLGWLSVGLLVSGAVLILSGIVLVAAALHGSRRRV